MRKFTLLFFLIFGICTSNLIYSQAILIKDKTLEDFKDHDYDFGPNRKKYSYSYYGVGKIVNASLPDSVFSVRWNALKVTSGYSKKRQVNKYLGLLIDLEISAESYALNKLDSTTVINFNSNIDKARYVFYKIGGDLAFQSNLRPKRGNQLGTYITLGMFGDYNIARRFVTKAKFENGFKVKDKVVYKKLPFAHPFQYGAVLKFGKHYFDIFAKYRISNAFNNGQLELPRLIIGLEFLLHND